METVYLFFEGDNIRIPLYDYDKLLFDQLFKSRMGYWEQANRQYSIPRSNYDPRIFKGLCGNKPVVEVGKEKDNPVIVHGFMSGSNDEPNETKAVTPESGLAEDSPIPEIPAPSENLPDQFPAHWLERLKIELHQRKYSDSTKSSYIKYNIDLCRWLQKPPDEVTSLDVKRYIAHLERDKKQAAATLNFNISAFKFFYGQVMENRIVQEHKRPRQDKNLPNVLSRNDILKMLDCENNPKHRLLLMMVYASGLRVGEAVNLKHKDVDMDEKVITVKKGKGRKSRKTIMSDMVYEALKIYFTEHTINEWLFTGYDPKEHIAVRTAQHVCENALKKAGIKKDASMHSLRHSFATHLLENGIDICRIRDLMGHKSVRTTERYTQVAKLKALNITSPLDMLKRGHD